MTVLTLRFRTTQIAPFGKFIAYTAVIVVTFLACYLVSLPRLRRYHDFTANQGMTLSSKSQAILGSLHRPLQITPFVNVIDRTSFFGSRSVRNKMVALFDPYLRFMPDLQVQEAVYYYNAENEVEMAEKYPGKGLTELLTDRANYLEIDPLSIKPSIALTQEAGLQSEMNRFAFKLEADGKHAFLRVFNDIAFVPAEAQISSSLQRLITAPAKVHFLVGH